MKKILVFICFLSFLFSCTNKHFYGPITPNTRGVLVISGEYFEGYEMRTYKMWDTFPDVLYFDSGDNIYIGKHENVVSATFYPDYPKKKQYFNFSATDSQGNIVPWRSAHLQYFLKIDGIDVVRGKSHVFFLYLKVKSLKFYSTNKEICGRKIGEDLSDLFYFRNVRLYSYPDCSFTVSCFEAAPEKVTFDKLVELNLMPEAEFVLYPTFEHDPDHWLDDVTFRLELTTEDEVRGEKTFTSESYVGRDRPGTSPSYWCSFK